MSITKLSPKPTTRAKEKESATQQVANRLRKSVLRGQYAPGQRLRETDLVGELGVSKAPIREAMHLLSREGLVQIEHHRGYVVKRLSREEIRDVYELLEPLAVLVARNAAMAVNEGKDSISLSSALKRVEATKDQGNVVKFMEAVEDWRQVLDSMGHNKKLPELIAQIRMPIFRLQLRNLIQVSEIPKVINSYKKITSAVITGKVEHAEREMRRHVKRSAELIEVLPDEYFD